MIEYNNIDNDKSVSTDGIIARGKWRYALKRPIIVTWAEGYTGNCWLFGLLTRVKPDVVHVGFMELDLS